MGVRNSVLPLPKKTAHEANNTKDQKSDVLAIQWYMDT